MAKEMRPGDRIAHKFAQKFLRGAVVGFVVAFVTAGVTGFFHVPKADAMAYTFYLGLLIGLTSFIVPVREKKPPTAE